MYGLNRDSADLFTLFTLSSKHFDSGEKTQSLFPPVGLAAELAQVEAAELAAALGGSFPAQVAAQRAVRHQALPEHLVQRQVVGAQTLGPRRREVHLGVAVGTQHRDRGPVLRGSGGGGGGGSPADVRRGHGKWFQLSDTVQAEGMQTRQDFGLSVQPFAHVAKRPLVPRSPVTVHIRPGSTSLGSLFGLQRRHVSCF